MQKQEKKKKEKKFLTFGIILIIIQILAMWGNYLNDSTIGFSPLLIVLTIVDFALYFNEKSK